MPHNPDLDTHRAFTLTEMLVSMTILALLVLFVSQLFNSASAIVVRGRKGIDSDREARIIFDRMATDFGRMVRRKDVDFYGKDTSASRAMDGNDQIAFYSDVRGYYSSPSPTATPTRNQRNPISLIGFTISNDSNGRPQLVRLAKGLVWEPDGTWPGLSHLPIRLINSWPNLFQYSTTSPPSFHGMADSDFEVISDSVVRFEYCYLLRSTASSPAITANTPYDSSVSGHTVADFAGDVAAVIISVALLDQTSRAIVSDYSRITSQTVFADSSNADTAAVWIAATNQSGFAATSNIPKTAAAGIKVYQRRFSFLGSN